MEEKRPQAPNRTGEPIAPQRSSAPQEAALYLRWLGILCAIMAAFCLGVFAIGYKDPSVGRVATLAGLIVASAGFFCSPTANRASSFTSRDGERRLERRSHFPEHL